MFAPRILALETSGQSGSVAFLVGEQLVAQIVLDPARRSAQTLAPALQEALACAGWQPREVQVVATIVGPGSFTGLRVGVTTAKTFAYAVGAKFVGVNTLDVIAAQAVELPPDVQRLAVAVDAQRGEVFAASYRPSTTNHWQLIEPAAILSREDWLGKLGAGDAVTGPALDKLFTQIPEGVSVVGREHWQPQAATVGRLAARRAAAEEFDDLWKLAPLYLRRSAAEEKLDGK